MDNDITIKDEFWVNNIPVLFQSNRLIEFVPKEGMNYNEKLNAIFRFSIYLSILLYLLKSNYLVFYIPIFVGILTYVLHNNFFNNYLDKSKLHREEFKNMNRKDSKLRKKCQLPSSNNPFMNVLLTDRKYRPHRPKACNPLKKKVKESIEDNFNINLYKNVSDVYGKDNSQRQYYTTPSTTIPNDQDSFANWLYKTPNTCKEGNDNQCISNIYDPQLSDTTFNYKYI
jgi:hypothetical protein